MREPDRQRHQRLGLVRRVAEHHALVAGADGAIAVVGAGGDVRRLAVEVHLDGAAVGVDVVRGIAVTDLAQRLADDGFRLVAHLGEVRGIGGAEFPGDDHPLVGDEGLAGDAGARVAGQEGVENRIGDAVADLVGMAGGDRLGREQTTACGHGRTPL